jgi:hypothetical protein
LSHEDLTGGGQREVPVLSKLGSKSSGAGALCAGIDAMTNRAPRAYALMTGRRSTQWLMLYLAVILAVVENV